MSNYHTGAHFWDKLVSHYLPMPVDQALKVSTGRIGHVV